MLEILQHGLNKGLAHNIIRRHVAALSTVLSGLDRELLAHYLVICRFLQGASNLRPLVVHRYPTSDLPRVLWALMEPPFKPLRTASLRHLARKVVFLVAITSAQLIFKLAALLVKADLCIFHLD